MKTKGFTLIELLMVVVILGLVMSIAVIGVTSYINNFRKKTYVKTALSYIDSVKNRVNSGEYSFKNISSIYYVPISCIELEKGGKSPYGEFEKGYVVITFDGEKENYRFYARDVKGFGIENVEENKLSIASIKSNAKEVVFELIDEKEVIESIDEDTCNSELIMQPIPETKEECFEVDGNTIINYNDDKSGCGKVVSIPKEINNVKIEIIGASAFASKKIEKIVLSDYINEIGDYAFEDNKIKNLIIGNNVKSIGESAFQNNEIISLKLGTGITKIEPFVFQNNFITTIEIPEQIKEIGERAFFNNKLETIELSKELKSIGQRSFDSNELTSIEIPSSVNYIGAGAFTNNKLEKDTFVYSRNSDGSINYSEINSYAGKERKNVVIPKEVNGVKVDTLGERSFAGCFIENITIPESITAIKNYSLHGNSFTTITLPSNLKEIGNFAFWGTPIKQLEIPNSVVEIGSYFIYETQIKRITIPNSVLNLSSGAFNNTELDEIIIDNKKGALEGYPWGLESNFDRIKFLR